MMSTNVGAHEQACGVEEISLDRGRRMLDEAARQYLNMSAEEFIVAWDEARFTDRVGRSGAGWLIRSGSTACWTVSRPI